MTDLGFGMADKRSVLIVLFVFAIASIYFQYPLPIDTADAVRLFVSLLVVTGFIFIVRNIWRLLLMAMYFILRLPVDVLQKYVNSKNPKEREWSESETGIKKSFQYAVLIPMAYDEWSFASTGHSDYRLILGSLGILDRMFLIFTALAATIPQFVIYRTNIGFIGIVLMLAIYVFTGKFTFILKDAIQMAKEDHDRLVSAAGSQPNIYYPSQSSDNRSDGAGGL